MDSSPKNHFTHLHQLSGEKAMRGFSFLGELSFHPKCLFACRKCLYLFFDAIETALVLLPHQRIRALATVTQSLISSSCFTSMGFGDTEEHHPVVTPIVESEHFSNRRFYRFQQTEILFSDVRNSTFGQLGDTSRDPVPWVNKSKSTQWPAASVNGVSACLREQSNRSCTGLKKEVSVFLKNVSSALCLVSVAAARKPASDVKYFVHAEEEAVSPPSYSKRHCSLSQEEQDSVFWNLSTVFMQMLDLIIRLLKEHID